MWVCGTWHTRSREPEHQLRFEMEKMTLQMQWAVSHALMRISVIYISVHTHIFVQKSRAPDLRLRFENEIIQIQMQQAAVKCPQIWHSPFPKRLDRKSPLNTNRNPLGLLRTGHVGDSDLYSEDYFGSHLVAISALIFSGMLKILICIQRTMDSHCKRTMGSHCVQRSVSDDHFRIFRRARSSLD